MMVFTMSLATSFLDFFSKWNSFPCLSKIAILLVSVPNPAPSSFNEFKTIRSMFFFSNLDNAFSFSLLVSKANPTII